jgi:hypothetical protein
MHLIQHVKKYHRRSASPSYSIRMAGPSRFSSANDVFLDPALTSSFSIPTSFVQIHVDAYMFTLFPISASLSQHY